MIEGRSVVAGNTYESVASIIAKEARVPVETVTLGTTFEDLAVDSLVPINIVFEIEEVFNIAVTDEQMASLRSVRDVVDVIDELLAAKTAA